MPWWGIVLTVLGGLAVIGLLAEASWSRFPWKATRKFLIGTTEDRGPAQRTAATVVILAVITMALTHWGFFSDTAVPYSKDPSIWDYFFGDQPVLGVVRLVVFSAGLFVVASLAALLVIGRFIVGAGGVQTDVAKKVQDAKSLVDDQQTVINDYKAEIADLKAQRDQALAAARELMEKQSNG